MSTTPIAVVYNGATVNITAPVAGLTAAALLALIPSSFYGGVAVRLTAPSAPTTLIAPATALISTYSITVGTLYTFNLVAVKRYAVTNSADSNATQNQVNVDYLPGTSYTEGSVPTKTNLISDIVTAFNAVRSIALTTPAVAGTSHDNDAGWYGLYTTSSTTIIESSFITAGTYLFSPVSHYTIEVPHAPNVVVEYLANQTASVLLSATGIPAQSNPFPGLFINDNSVTDSNVTAKLIDPSTVVAPLNSLVSYIAMIVNKYTVIQPAVVAGTQTPLYNTPYPFSAVSAPDLIKFAVLAGGGVTNTSGATNTSGSFGSAPTNTVTVTAGTITVTNGTEYTTSNAATTNAHTQAVNLYNYLNSLTANVTPSSTLGTQSLTPGIYNSGSSLSFSGTITLNAAGNPNAIWVFQATTITFGTVVFALANSAQAGNVFFVASGAVTTAAATLMGNIVSASTITDSAGATTTGRWISTAGLITTQASTVNMPTTPTTTVTLTAAAAITNTIQTLENQTPLFLMNSLSVDPTANGLTINAANAPLLNNLIPISPIQQLMVTSVVQFTVVGATTVVVRGSWTETVSTLMQDPNLVPDLNGIAAGKQFTLYQNGTYTLPVSPVTQLQNVQSSYLYASTSHSLAFNTITVNLPGSNMPPYVQNFSNDATYGDTYTNVRYGAMQYFGALVDSATSVYCLFDATLSTPGAAYGPWSTNNTAVSATKVQATDPVKFNLVNLTQGQLNNVFGSSAGTAFFPASFQIQYVIAYLVSSAAQAMGSVSSPTIWILYSGSGAPFMPWQVLSAVSPSLNVSANQNTGVVVDLITDNDGTYALGVVSPNYTAAQYIAWTQNQFADLASETLTASTKLAAGNVPIYSVLAGSAIYPSPAASPTHNSLYIKQSTEVIIVPPTTIVRANIDATLPVSFTMYDLLNYAKTNFGFTPLLSYALYPVADPNHNALGPLDTVASIVSEFNISGAAQFQMVASNYVQVSVVYNSATTVLQAMPVSALMSEVLATATVSLNIQSPSVLEFADSTIVLTNPISTYAIAPATTGGLYTLTVNLQAQVKANVVLYNVNGTAVFIKKESLNMTAGQLKAAYIASAKLSAATVVTLTSLLSGSVASDSATLSSFARAISTAADQANLDPTDPTVVTKVVEFTESQSVQTMVLTVQNLGNLGTAASLTVPKFSTAAFVSAAVVSQFGYDVAFPKATFGIAVVGSTSVLSPTAITSDANVYILMETDSPLQLAAVTIGYTDQKLSAVANIVAASTPLSKLAGFDARMDILSLTNGGASLAPYTQTVGSLMNASTGVLQLYDSTQPNVSVTVSLNGTVKIVSVSPRSTMADVVAALGVNVATQPVSITEVSSGKVANLTDLLVSFTAPFSFTINNAPVTYNVTFSYGTQSASKSYQNGVLVSAMLTDAISLLSLDATKSYSLYAAGQTSPLAPTSAPDLTTVTSFTVQLSPVLGSNEIIALSSVGALGVLAAIFYFA